MSHSLFKHINIYFTIDEYTIDQYFNRHDPAPMYKRQLSQEFESYINTHVFAAKRYTTIQYRFNCVNEKSKQYIEPFTHAIRRHFSVHKTLKEAEFVRFKKRSYMQLGFGIFIGILCHWILPMFIPAGEQYGFVHTLKNSLDVLSWVTLWRPIDKLIFQWNPFLKDILLFDKLTNADVTVIDNIKKIAIENVA